MTFRSLLSHRAPLTTDRTRLSTSDRSLSVTTTSPAYCNHHVARCASDRDAVSLPRSPGNPLRSPASTISP